MKLNNQKKGQKLVRKATVDFELKIIAINRHSRTVACCVSFS